MESGFGELYGERQADVTESEHADVGGSAENPVFELFFSGK
jgi:hypothetical protein